MNKIFLLNLYNDIPIHFYLEFNYSIFRCTAFSYLEGDPELAYFAVYDGHGGTGVANYLKDHLHEFILDQPEYKKGNMEEAVYKAFLKVSLEIRIQCCSQRYTRRTISASIFGDNESIGSFIFN